MCSRGVGGHRANPAYRIAFAIGLTWAWSGCGTQPRSDPTAPPNDPDHATVGQGELTAEQAAAAELGLAAIQLLGRAIAGTLPSYELQDLVEGQGAMPTCPSLGLAQSADALVVAIEYGEGCTPAGFREARFAGKVESRVFNEVSAFEHVFDEFSVDGQAATGSIAGSQIPDGELVTVIASVRLSVPEGPGMTGAIEAAFNKSTRAFTLRAEQLAVSDAGGASLTVSIADAVFDPRIQETFIPSAGAATVIPSSQSTAVSVISLQFAEGDPAAIVAQP